MEAVIFIGLQASGKSTFYVVGYYFQSRLAESIQRNAARSGPASDPTIYDAPERFTSDPAILNVWAFLDRLDRSDVYVVDAARGMDEVYSDIEQYVISRTKNLSDVRCGS